MIWEEKKSEQSMEERSNNLIHSTNDTRFDGHTTIIGPCSWRTSFDPKSIGRYVEDGIPATVEDGAEETEAQRKAREDASLKDLRIKNDMFQAIDRTIMETILNKQSA